jgi:hypothetical protein
MIQAFERAKTVHALDRAATVIGFVQFSLTIFGNEGSVFWDVVPCGPVKVIRHFKGTCGLHLWGQGAIHSRIRQMQAGSQSSETLPS